MILNNISAISRQDTYGAFNSLAAYPDHAADALAADEIAFPANWPRMAVGYNAVVIVGFGTGAAAGVALAQLAAQCCTVPVLVLRDRELPAYVGTSTLVIVTSCSGDTADTFEVYNLAVVSGARVVAVTFGGALGSAVEDRPIAKLSGDILPQYSLAAIFFAMYRILASLGLIERQGDAENETVSLLAQQEEVFAPQVDEDANPAKALASALLGKLPIIYAGCGRLSPIAERWRAQINSAGKLQAHSNAYPELTHNELLSWRNAERQCQQWAVVVVRDRAEDALTSARVTAAADVIPEAIDVHEIFVEGKSLMARIWTGLYFADFTSAYLGIAWGEDPSAV